MAIKGLRGHITAALDINGLDGLDITFDENGDGGFTPDESVAGKEFPFSGDSDPIVVGSRYSYRGSDVPDGVSAFAFTVDVDKKTVDYDITANGVRTVKVGVPFMYTVFLPDNRMVSVTPDQWAKALSAKVG